MRSVRGRRFHRQPARSEGTTVHRTLRKSDQQEEGGVWVAATFPISLDQIRSMGEENGKDAGTRTGGAYVPPFKLAQMLKEAKDKSGPEYQVRPAGIGSRVSARRSHLFV